MVDHEEKLQARASNRVFGEGRLLVRKFLITRFRNSNVDRRSLKIFNRFGAIQLGMCPRDGEVVRTVHGTFGGYSAPRQRANQ